MVRETTSWSLMLSTMAFWHRTLDATGAIDMDEDGSVDWNEVGLYLKWAIREYPETLTAEELLSIAFRKGLMIPAMQDEVLKQA